MSAPEINTLSDKEETVQLQKNARDYPYSALAQYSLLCHYYCSSHPDFENQLRKTALYFPNHNWLQFQLSQLKNVTTTGQDQDICRDDDESFKRHFAVISEEQLKELKEFDMRSEKSVGTEEEHHQSDVSTVSDQDESQIDNDPASSTIEENGLNSQITGQVNEDKEATYVSNDESSLDETVTETNEEPGSTAEEPTGNYENESGVKEDENLEAEEMGLEAHKQDIDIIAENNSTDTNDETHLPGSESGQPAQMEEENESVVSIEAINEAPEEAEHEASADEDDEPNIQIPGIKEVSGDNTLAFEPLHTVDYFASQGIILTDEAISNDKLGTQMKSFTDWLKSMKKLHPGKLEPEASLADDIVKSAAEDANIDTEVLTEAMAEVLIKQDKKEKAIDMYQKLSLINPSKSAYFAAKIDKIKND
ncbi:hypothetical protein BH20BAC1_BH20BAC1_07900 [soil metagenome]